MQGTIFVKFNGTRNDALTFLEERGVTPGQINCPLTRGKSKWSLERNAVVLSAPFKNGDEYVAKRDALIALGYAKEDHDVVQRSNWTASQRRAYDAAKVASLGTPRQLASDARGVADLAAMRGEKRVPHSIGQWRDVAVEARHKLAAILGVTYDDVALTINVKSLGLTLNVASSYNDPDGIAAAVERDRAA